VPVVVSPLPWLAVSAISSEVLLFLFLFYFYFFIYFSAMVGSERDELRGISIYDCYSFLLL
jgi:hypothetical protein